MLKWLKRIFNMENTTTTENISAVQPSAVQKTLQTRTPLVRKFEIAVYDITLNEASGKEEYRPIAYEQPVVIEATSPADLKSKLGIYRQCGQFAKVIREVDPPPPQSRNPALLQQSSNVPVQHEANTDVPVASVINQDTEHNTISRPKQKPRIYRLGDIEIKDDNGKIYQKQWMKLTDSEAANFRVINDKNNSITSLAGKHIEMKKWVLVEDVDEDETSSIEENMQ